MVMEGIASQNNGTLADIPLPKLLRRIYSSRKTGVLLLNYPDERLNSRFFFAGGRIGHVLTPFGPKISDVLASRGAPSQRVKALQQYLRSNERQRTQMLQEGKVKTRFLALALESRVRIALFPIFSNTSGSFEFHEGEKPAGFIEPGADTYKIITDIGQRLEELNEYGAWTLSPFDTFRVVGDVGDFSKGTGDFTVLEWRILAALFEPRSLLQISTELILNWDELLRVLLLLERRNIVEQVDASSSNKARLEAGAVAPGFTLASVNNEIFTINARRGRRTLLVFLSYPGSPYANLYVQELINHYPSFRAARVDIVCIFGAPAEGIKDFVGLQNPPFTLLADSERKGQQAYSIKRSWLGWLDLRNLPGLLVGWRLSTVGGSSYGQRFTMPAVFLVHPSLRISHAYYGRYANDNPKIELLEAWMNEGV